MPLKSELGLRDEAAPPGGAQLPAGSVPEGDGPEFDPEHLLHQIQDERTRARRREAVFGSIILHLLIIILILVDPKLFRSKPLLLSPQRYIEQHRQLTYLQLPHLKLPKPKLPVHSHVISNRSLQIHQHHRVLNSLAAPAVPRPAPRPPAPRMLAENQPPAPRVTPRPKPPAAKPAGGGKARGKGGIKLESVPNARQPRLPLPGMSVADQLRDAMRAAARQRVEGGQSAAESSRLPAPQAAPGEGGGGRVGAGVQMLTNTQGVDFSSYLQRVVHAVKINWYAVMPEEAYLGRKGRVVIIFVITRTGLVPGLQLVSPSGTISFDHAALAAISASNPFPPLPAQFRGPSIKLQFSFFYNLRPRNY